ncbi:MAG: alpha/beta hydrolase-fold protein, partial [Gemmatimonadaceae bacterium]
CVPWSHYDDYIAHDLVAFVDAHYRTQRERTHRGIAGLSMGGYGAITLALRYPDVFSSAASHSGVLSPMYNGAHPFDGTPRYATNFDSLKAGWGDRFWPLIAPAFGSDTAAWRSREPAWLAQRLHHDDPTHFPAIFIDCGTEDGLVDHARSFRAELERMGITPRYAEWPGKHEWSYWQRHASESAAWLARQLSGT